MPAKSKTSKTDYASNDIPLRPGDAFVAICDWNGVVKWLSNHSIKTQVGDLGWSNMVAADAKRFQLAFAQTSTLHEKCNLEIESLDGKRYRIWMWSIGNPELAVCTFNLLIPFELNSLTAKERQLMKILATGVPIKQIAKQMDVSVNTVHTHSRNIRSKLAIKESSELAAFAVKFFHHSCEDPPSG